MKITIINKISISLFEKKNKTSFNKKNKTNFNKKNNFQKIGQGYDVHKLGENRNLVICGKEIECKKNGKKLGLIGHSDADVAVHALMDSMLGATGFPDIGIIFPDNNPKFKNISSMKLLKFVNTKIMQKGFKVSNADITIIAEFPKMSPHIPEMKKNLAKILGISVKKPE
jgi:2-C-methyl-D-erythritol 2,4-cyclodiphosphate synthase